MYRAAASRIGLSKGYVGNIVSARPSSSSAIIKSSSGGFFKWLLGTQPPPLDRPFENVNLPSSLPDYVEPSKTNITDLPNGLKFVSETSTSPMTSIGFYINCGSIYETPDSFGVSYLLERMAFKTTTNRSHFRIVRELEAIGCNAFASASRDHMCYTFDGLRTNVPEMVELLIDCFKNAAFLDWEFKEELEYAKSMSHIEEAVINPHKAIIPHKFLSEIVHTVGYSGALGNPLLAPESAYERLNCSILEDFVSEHFTAPRIVLAASGVEHEELISAAEPFLSDFPSAPLLEEPKSVYIGGDYRCNANIKKTHATLAFEFPGGRRKEKDYITLTVLRMLMGGSGSFSAGYPGNGLRSRLYDRVLREHPEFEDFFSFSSIYNDSSLFGIHITTGPKLAENAIDLAARELVAITQPGDVDEAQLNRAKASTKASILMSLESRAISAKDMARQVLTFGERKPVEHLLKVVDGVSVEDICRVASKLISSPLTFASYGDVAYVPSYEEVRRKFGSKLLVTEKS